MLNKRKSAGDQNGVGYCPFPIWSRHCSGVAIGGPAVCTIGMRTLMTEDLRSRAGMPGKACRDRECPIATEMACPESHQINQCRDRVWSFGVATQSWCHDRIGLVGGVATCARLERVTERLSQDRRVLSRQRILCRDRLYNIFFSIATGFTIFSIET